MLRHRYCPPSSGLLHVIRLSAVDYLFPIVFFVIWGTFMLGMFGGMAVGIAALVSASKVPAESFGPWWDNTKTPWILGIVVSFMVPFGMLISGIYWFRTGRASLRTSGAVARPFWMGPPKPPPPYPPAVPGP